MTVHTASDIYAAMIAAGDTPAAATIQTAIDLAESGGNDQAIGDVALENSTWGPSVGVSQIRTLKAQTGTGSWRDINWLMGSLPNQAAASYQISQAGSDFTPWSTYDSGAYQQYMGQAEQAAAQVGSGSAGYTTGGGTPAQTVSFGPWWAPWNLPGAVSQAQQQTLTGARSMVLELGFVLAGLGLAGAGLVVMTRPARQKATAAAGKAASAAEKTAAVAAMA